MSRRRPSRGVAGPGRLPVAVLLLAGLALCGWLVHANATAQPVTVTGIPAGVPTSQPNQLGPDVVILRELVALYEPVPFDHKSHAEMAEMWDGCVTCHHRQPAPDARNPELPVAAFLPPGPGHAQAEAAEIPACKSCHPIAGDEFDLHMPSLKGAYHRQCLGCHREWTGQNDCVICHAPLNGNALGASTPAPDDIVGRMHPPIPAPQEKLFTARFTPVAGRNVLFRHDDHVARFGVRCVHCHRRDNCADCHAPGTTGASVEARPRPSPMSPGRTWRDTHTPCISCHFRDSCSHCHYPDGGEPTPSFDHARVGQLLDADHASLHCADCHSWFKDRPTTCGDNSCHPSRPVSFPHDRPGPLAVTAPPNIELAPASQPATRPATTRPTIVRIRRGGS